MPIPERDIKLLWGRAAQRCSFPGCKIRLTQDRSLASGSLPLGEQAYIVGKTTGSPRGKSNLTEEERESYYNLILLCPVHHAVIDNDPKEYTIEKLHYFKDEHESWVEHTLSESKDSVDTVQNIIYADLIDAVVEACRIDSWDKWASRALSTNMNWDDDAHPRLFEFHNKVFGSIWPGTLPELECSLQVLAYEIYQAIHTFMEHCKPSEAEKGVVVEDRFYRISEWNPGRYKQLSEEYDIWQNKCHNHILDATRAVNWFADVVRRDLNPLFFATKGKFFVIMGPYQDIEFRSYFLEYTRREKSSLLRKCKKGWDISIKIS